MEAWQKEYLDNIDRVKELTFLPEAETARELEEKIEAVRDEARRLAERNSALVRENLFPALELVPQASQEELDALYDFAQILTKGQRPDNGIALHIHEALLTTARNRHDQEMLLRELYQCGICTFYQFTTPTAYAVSEDWLRRIRLYFREAASYLRVYEQIPSTESRGYIHRAMGNIALSYGRNEFPQKLRAINASLRVLSDPYYREKTPDLPWDAFVYATHQERTTLLYSLRTGDTTPEVVAQVMESAQYVHNIQLERAKKQGKPLEAKWKNVYNSALFYCGITDVNSFMQYLVDTGRSARLDDYSADGMFMNIDTTAYLMDMLQEFGKQEGQYDSIANEMLRHSLCYIAHLPKSIPLHKTVDRLLSGFDEFSGGMTLTELFHRLAPLTARDLYLHSVACGEFARYLVQLARQDAPELVRDLGDEAEDMAARAGLLHDIGMLRFPQSYMFASRQLLQDEWELIECHCDFSQHLLFRNPSTRALATAVQGHHWPEYTRTAYRRSEDKTPMLTDIVHLSDMLGCCVVPNCANVINAQPVDECIHTLEENPSASYQPQLVHLVLAHREELEGKVTEIKEFSYNKLMESINLMKNMNI